MKAHGLVLLFVVSFVLAGGCITKVDHGRGTVIIAGEMKQWHDIVLTFDGPQAEEAGEPNPFLDYRLDVTFVQGQKQYVVPGYYAADGNCRPDRSHRRQQMAGPLPAAGAGRRGRTPSRSERGRTWPSMAATGSRLPRRMG